MHDPDCLIQGYAYARGLADEPQVLEAECSNDVLRTRMGQYPTSVQGSHEVKGFVSVQLFRVRVLDAMSGAALANNFDLKSHGPATRSVCRRGRLIGMKTLRVGGLGLCISRACPNISARVSTSAKIPNNASGS